MGRGDAHVGLRLNCGCVTTEGEVSSDTGTEPSIQRHSVNRFRQRGKSKRQTSQYNDFDAVRECVCEKVESY